MKLIFTAVFTCILLGTGLSQSSVESAYSAGHIATSFSAYDATCNGPLTTLSVTLPATLGSYDVTGINIEYEMVASNIGYMADQRSQIYCQNTSTLESNVYQGAGNTTGTYLYNRNDVDIANGDYNPSDVITFEMRAWRTFDGTGGCSTNENRVEDGTWVITVFYNLCPPFNVSLHTQTEVNAFAANLNTIYSNCQYVLGNLTIGQSSTPSDITSLSSITNQLDSVGQIVEITNNPLLTTFNFTELSDIGALFITDNSDLTSFGFPNLEKIEYDIVVNSNSSLTSIEFLTIDSIGGRSIISENAILSSINFPNLLTAGGFRIGANIDDIGGNNPLLSTIELPLLEELGSFIAVFDVLSELSLPSVTEISIINIDGINLETLSFENLEESSTISIYGGHLLDSLNLDNVNLNSLSEFTIDTFSPVNGFAENTILDNFDFLRNLNYINKIEIRGFNNFYDCCFLVNFFPKTCPEIILEAGCGNFPTAVQSCKLLDPDEDGFLNSEDNCPDIYNPNQEDNDTDMIGNACDNCPLIANNLQADINDNFIGDACENPEPGSVGVNTSAPSSGLEVMSSDLYINDSQRSLIMKNANDDCFRLLVSPEGELQIKRITCPN